jgi:quercetin dioxygenase-like cupin family protein
MSDSQKLVLLSEGLPVAPIYWKILQHPELWNQHTARTEDPASPHHGLDDIWARYGDPERAHDGLAHDSFWYPPADILGLKPLCHEIMRRAEGVELGGVLITRIPPGATCKPHTDPGWHARRYEKFAVQITSAPGQRFHFDDESIETKPGDLYWFDNQFTHWVTNDTPYERVTMIVCIRRGN